VPREQRAQTGVIRISHHAPAVVNTVVVRERVSPEHAAGFHPNQPSLSVSRRRGVRRRAAAATGGRSRRRPPLRARVRARRNANDGVRPLGNRSPVYAAAAPQPAGCLARSTEFPREFRTPVIARARARSL